LDQREEEEEEEGREGRGEEGRRGGNRNLKKSSLQIAERSTQRLNTFCWKRSNLFRIGS